MNIDNKILELFQKVICSLVCIEKKSEASEIVEKAHYFLIIYIEQYEIFLNKKTPVLSDVDSLISFCNECYEQVDVFDFAEDVEYGVKELVSLL